VLETRRRILPTDHLDTLQSVNDLCRLAVETKQFKVAEPLAYEYEHGIRCTRGPNHPNNVTALRNQGLIARLQGKVTAAAHFHQRAAQEARRILGPAHPATAAAEKEYTALLDALNVPVPDQSAGP
jgi:hypothetical protein